MYRISLRFWTFVFLLLLAAVSPGRAQWRQVAEGKTGRRTAPALVWAGDMKRALLVGGETGADTPTIMAFDPATGAWEAITTRKLPVKRAEYFNISGRVACSARHKTIYAYAWDQDTGNWGELYTFDLARQEWALRPSEPLLEQLAFCSMVCDEKRDRLLVVVRQTP